MSTPRRPRVEAACEIDGIEYSTTNGYTYSSPAITLEVSFDLHDHDTALNLLDNAVAGVKAQIEDTKGTA